MRILFVGGGTGGHFYPLIAIAEAIRDRDSAHANYTDLYFIGPEPYNAESLARLNITYVFCPSGKQRRYFSILNFFDLFKVIFGIIYAIKQLYLLYPDVVMSKGSYTSVPVVVAAWILRIPIVVHESDAAVGRANRLGGKLARYVGVSYPKTQEYFKAEKVAVTGHPIRKYFHALYENPAERLGVPTSHPILFITGGSTGADRINTLVLDTLDELLPEYTVIHQVGEENVAAVTRGAGGLISDASLLHRYFIFGHMTGEHFAWAAQSAELIISRAGSGSIAEISLIGKPAILIPIPEEISHDQRSNAYAYAKRGGATVLEEGNLTDGMLFAQINQIVKDPSVHKKMSGAAKGFTQPSAAYTLADTLLGIGKEHF